MKEKAYVGIDPGITGGLAVITPDGVDVTDYNDIHNVVATLIEWGENYVLNAMLEKVHSMPKQGVASTFKFGMNYGIHQGILAALGIPYQLVTPQKWMGRMLTGSDELTTKKKSLDIVRRLYPSLANVYFKRQKDNGRADALLIATYCKLNWGVVA